MVAGLANDPVSTGVWERRPVVNDAIDLTGAPDPITVMDIEQQMAAIRRGLHPRAPHNPLMASGWTMTLAGSALRWCDVDPALTRLWYDINADLPADHLWALAGGDMDLVRLVLAEWRHWVPAVER